MTNAHFDQALVVLNVPPSLEEAIIDWLLARQDGAGFTSIAASGHSACHQGLSAAEQVSGRQRRLQFQIQMRTESVDAFLASARATFGTADVHYWVLPMSTGGHLNPSMAFDVRQTQDLAGQ